MKKIILYILLAINALGLDLELISKVKIPDTSLQFLNQSPYISIDYIRNDGVFLAKCGTYGGNVIIVNPTSKSFSFPLIDSSELLTTNYVSQYTKDNQLHIVFDVFLNSTYSENDGILAAKTIGKNGFLTQERCSKISQIVRQDVSPTKTESTVTSQSHTKFTQITRYDVNGNKLLSRSFTNISFSITPNNISPSFNNPNSKLAIHYEIKDGFIYFYKLTDSDIFDIISPNRITLGSSQNGSLTATVNNPEQALLNIQSSTNLIDWNTFTTIQNQPSLEVVIPANKPKEFIRAIE